MTPIQCKMARSALGWSVIDLAENARINKNTIVSFENNRDVYKSSLEKIQSAFESCGVQFISKNGGGVGVRLKE